MAEWWEDLYTGVTDYFSGDDDTVYDETDYLDGGAASPSFWDSVVDFADDFDLNSPAVEALQKYFRTDPSDPTSDFSSSKVGAGLSGIAQVAGLLGLIDTDGSDDRPTGYQGEIPKDTAVRSRVGETYDPTRRPGSGGQRYFSDVQYVSPENVPTAQASTAEQAATLRQANIDNPAQQRTPVAMMRGGIARLSGGGQLSQQDKAAAASRELDRKTAEMTEQGITSEFTYGGNTIINFENEEAKAAYEISEILRKLRAGEITIEQAEEFMRQNQPPQQMPQPVQPTAPMGNGMAQGGIASMKPKGYYLGGATDGMADKVPATIDNQQPAALSDGEFVVPADVVSHLGNGNSNAGAQQLYSMMDNIRQARTGNKQQGKQINPNKIMPA